MMLNQPASMRYDRRVSVSVPCTVLTDGNKTLETWGGRDMPPVGAHGTKVLHFDAEARRGTPLE